MQALLSLFAGAALLLAGLGLYGVLSFTVGARLRELGIRAALGARRKDLALRVGRTVLAHLALGLAAGLVAGALGSRLLGGLLYGIRPGDPAAHLAAALTLLAAALLACLGPLRRATRLDPARVLRAE
jgi:ABC-type antimicrobial peptide transport system permease subunit